MTSEGQRPQPLAVVAVLLLLGSLVAVAGICVSAAGAPEIGVVDDWGRVDEAAGRVASWELVLVVLAATLLVAWAARQTAVSSVGARWQRTALVIALVEVVVIVGAAIAGALALFERTFVGPPTTSLYSDTEQIGESAAYAGVLLAIIAVGFLIVSELRRGRTVGEEARDQAIA